MKSSDQYNTKCMLQIILAGAFWTQSRLKEANPLVTEVCKGVVMAQNPPYICFGNVLVMQI